ncbi:SDR family NAD(P)-dependent oxidoreductase [Pedobacter sp. MC2016-05]|uniref:SDR family NAD(P)-dependent oxidoreductase n=1 Tax=Pedobacter sp. MC2016-05 TaxID=2994474 RepID=UPI003A522B71
MITGASSGSGRAAALKFAKNGDDLVIVARHSKALKELAEECRAFGGACKSHINRRSQLPRSNQSGRKCC